MVVREVKSRFEDRYRFSKVEFAVAVSGVVSMGLEIVAGRVLAPRFGSTIYTWGSIIGISMLALSLGYLHGGRTSSSASVKDLERYLVYTSAYILFVLFAGESLLTASAGIPVDARYASIIPVTLLFGPPTYFLGYISPYAAQLSSKATKGEASGHFYAVGTAGSILGAFGTTFLLVPNFSVDTIYLMFGTLSVLPVLFGSRDLKQLAPLIVVAAGFLALQTPAVNDNVVYSDSTVYQELEVRDSAGVRTLYLDGQPQSAIYLNGSGYPWGYLDYFHIPLALNNDTEDVLFIGGGGFVGPQEFAERGYDVDAVELDPGVVKAAENYFNLTESENLDVYTQDGRDFLQQTDQEYDVVYLDAYRKSKVPFHLTTKEFMELAYKKTGENGILMSNIISTTSGPGSKFAKSQSATMKEVYNSLYFFPTQNTDLAQNIELMAMKNDRLRQEDLQRRVKSYEARNLSDEVSMLRQIDTSGAQILTDDYAPVDELLNPLLGRDYVID